MAEKEKRTPADAEKVERWDRTIRNGDRTVELQYLRDEIMKEVNIDGSTDNPSDRERTPQNIILLGDTGSGKTMIAEKAAQVSGLPYVLVDASTLTASGWKGGDIEEVFARLYAKGNLAEYGIVIFDEVDKLVNMGFSADGKNVGRERQSIFLKIMEGVPITDSDGRDKAKEYKTKNMMFIFTGRFEAIEEKRNAEKRPFGFGEKVAGKKDGSTTERDAVLRRELRDAGVIEELIGRLAYIEELEVMSEEQMYTAVMTSPDSELNKAKEYVPSIYKKKLTVDCGYIQNIVAEMKKTSLGVRGCNNYLRSRIMELLFDSYEKGDETITLTRKEDAPDCGISVRAEKEEA